MKLWGLWYYNVFLNFKKIWKILEIYVFWFMWIMVSEFSLSIYYGDKYVMNMCWFLDILVVYVVYWFVFREDNDCGCIGG